MSLESVILRLIIFYKGSQCLHCLNHNSSSTKGAIYTSSQNPHRVKNISVQAAFAKDSIKIATLT